MEALKDAFVSKSKDGKMVLNPDALKFHDGELAAQYAQAVETKDPALRKQYNRQAEAIESRIAPVKNFLEVKAWMEKNDLATIANNSAAALCAVISYYNLAKLNGKETRTFPRFYREELEKGNIGMGRQVRRDGKTIEGAFLAIASAAWDQKYKISRKSDIDVARSRLEKSAVETAIVFIDTDVKADDKPNHFCIIKKTESGAWKLFDHASSLRYNAKIEWSRIYEIRYME
jgi:hypothetical protein